MESSFGALERPRRTRPSLGGGPIDFVTGDVAHPLSRVRAPVECAINGRFMVDTASRTRTTRVMKIMKRRFLNSETSAPGFSALAVLVAVAVVFVAPAAGQRSQAAGATVNSFYELKTRTLEGKPADLGDVSRQSHARRQRREQVRLHATVRRAREAAEGNGGEGVQRARVPEQRLRQPGARHGGGDRRRSASSPTA